MSRFGPVRCYDCGTPLNDFMEAFNYMKAILELKSDQKVHIDKRILDTKPSMSVNAIFEALNIRKEKDCCRTRFLTTILPKDLETRGTAWSGQ